MNENQQQRRKIPSLGWILIIIFIGIVFASISTPKTTNQNSPDNEVKKATLQAQAKVNFTGSKFVFTNANDFDWKEVEIVINEKYRYKATDVKSGNTYEVGALQFTDSKNNRFNPFEVKPSEIRVYVKDPPSDDWYGGLR